MALEELPHTFPHASRGEYANPPKQQGGPWWAKAGHEAKRNREKTSQSEPLGRVMGESWE